MHGLNWRNAKDYGHLKALSLRRWAWEFLRRNPEYKVYYKQRYVPGRQTHSLSYLWVPEAGEKWGVETVFAPEVDAPFIFSNEYGVRIVDAKTVHLLHMQPHERMTCFDLTKPLTPQLAQAKELLSGEQRRQKKPIKHTKKQSRAWVMYLRVLDAHHQKAKRKEAALVLFPKFTDPLEQYSENLKQAKRLMNSGYKKWLE